MKKFLVLLLIFLTACAKSTADNGGAEADYTAAASENTQNEAPRKYRPYWDDDTTLYGLEYTDGEKITEPIFDTAEDYFEYDTDELIPVSYERKYGYVDVSGQFVIEPQFDYAELFDPDGSAMVELDGLHGRILENGEYQIQPIYEAVGYFGNYELAPVKKDGKYGYINKAGEYVIDPVYDGADNFSEDLASVKSGGKWGYIDMQGNTVIDFRFEDHPKDFVNGTAIVTVVTADGNRDGVIDKNGDFVLDPIYYQLSWREDGGYIRADMPVEGYKDYQGHDWKSGYVDLEGNWYDEVNGHRP